MRRAITDAAVLTLAAGALSVIATTMRPGERELILDVLLLVSGGLALLTATRIARGAQRLHRGGSRFDDALRRPARRDERPAELTRLEADVELAAARAFDVHARLRPLLREIAEHRLMSRRGIDLHGDPARARAVLGELAWDLVREDRPPPEDRMGPGLPLAEQRFVVDAVERI